MQSPNPRSYIPSSMSSTSSSTTSPPLQAHRQHQHRLQPHPCRLGWKSDGNDIFFLARQLVAGRDGRDGLGREHKVVNTQTSADKFGGGGSGRERKWTDN
ncbi:hypothetical protein ACFX19_028142 [Malus domestica]